MEIGGLLAAVMLLMLAKRLPAVGAVQTSSLPMPQGGIRRSLVSQQQFVTSAALVGGAAALLSLGVKSVVGECYQHGMGACASSGLRASTTFFLRNVL